MLTLFLMWLISFSMCPHNLYAHLSCMSQNLLVVKKTKRNLRNALHSAQGRHFYLTTDRALRFAKLKIRRHSGRVCSHSKAASLLRALCSSGK